MTTQSILILIGIVSVFAIFGITLAWADFYTQRRPKAGGTNAAASRPNEQNIHDERRAA